MSGDEYRLKAARNAERDEHDVTDKGRELKVQGRQVKSYVILIGGMFCRKEMR